MDDQVGDAGLLERRLERLDQLMRELADEPDRVGDQVAAAVVLVGAGGRVEGVEEPLADADPRAGERVQQGRFAGVRVTGERDRRHGGRFAPRAHHAAILLDADETAPQRRDPVASEAAVGLDLRLARSAGADAAVHAPGAQALEVRPQAAHPRQVVLELGELDLELALGRMGVVGEDVEDDRGAVDHGDVERRLEVALLARRELVVAGDQVGAGALDLGLQLGELAAAEVAVGVGRLAHLQHLAGGRDAGRAQQLLQLGELVIPLPGGLRRDADRDGTLARAGVADARLETVRRRARGAVRAHPVSVRRAPTLARAPTGTGSLRATRRARRRRSRPSARRCRSSRDRARGRSRSRSGWRSRRSGRRAPGSCRTGR